MEGRKNGRRKGRKKETKGGEKEEKKYWNLGGRQDNAPGSEEPVKIFLKKKLDADSAALSRK